MTALDLPRTDGFTVCYSFPRMNAQERFVLRVAGLLEDRRSGARKLNQKDLLSGLTEGAVSMKMRSLRPLTLVEADEIAANLGKPLSELVRQADDCNYELTGTEARLVDAFRSLSPTEQQALITMATLRYRRVGRPSKKGTIDRDAG